MTIYWSLDLWLSIQVDTTCIIIANDLIRTDHLQDQAEADGHSFQLKMDTPLLV